MSALSDGQVEHLRGLVDLPDVAGTRYEIVKRIATGGMATVFLARDRELLRHVALKVLTVHETDARLADRLIAEARTVARLEHPGIVPVHDAGRLADGRVYYTMKFVEGTTLEEHRRSAPALPELLRLLLRVCDALEFAHARGVLHRDLKPSNIMVGPFGEVLVMDWGIATRLRAAEGGGDVAARRADATGDGAIAGTPAYMSPEQADGDRDRLDRRTDVYGVGAVLYFLITGRPPVEGDTRTDALARVRRGDIRRPRQVRSDVPRRLEAICLKALHREAAERYASVADLARDLMRFLDGGPVAAYRESPLERIGRLIARNQTIVIIVLVYLLVRFLIFSWRRI
jgi:serine/threonine protein kinase